MPFLNGSRDRFATDDAIELVVRLFGCLRLVGLGCRDDAFDDDVDVDGAAEADLFGIFDAVDFD